MSKYIEALDTFCNATAVFKEEEGRLVYVAYNDHLSKETSILQEAISKAEKYDELLEENEKLSGYYDFHKKLIEDLTKIYKDDTDKLLAENERLNAEKKILVDGIKAMVGVTVFYDRGVVSVSGLGYGEDSDIRYDSIVKSFEIVEGKK